MMLCREYDVPPDATDAGPELSDSQPGMDKAFPHDQLTQTQTSKIFCEQAKKQSKLAEITPKDPKARNRFLNDWVA